MLTCEVNLTISISLIVQIILINTYKGVYSINIVDGYLTFNSADIDKFHLQCHYNIYTFINEKLYLHHPYNSNTRIQTIKQLYMRLHRVYYKGNRSSLVKIIQPFTWFFLHFLKAWDKEKTKEKEETMIAMAYKLIQIIREYIVPITVENDHNKQVLNNCINFCEQTLKAISYSSCFMEERLYYIFKRQAIVETKEIGLGTEIEYGFIYLLMTKKEYTSSIQFSENSKKILLIDIMQCTIIEIVDIMTDIFFNISTYIKNSAALGSKNIFDETSEVGVMLKIIISIYNYSVFAFTIFSRTLVERTEYNFNIKSQCVGDKDLLPNLTKEYVDILNIFKIKWSNVLPSPREVASVFNIHNLQDNDYIRRTDYEDRLTSYDEAQNQYLMLLSMYRYYSIIEIDPNRRSQLPDLIEKDNIKLLLELRGWLTMIIRYAELMEHNTANIRKKELTPFDENFQKQCIVDKVPRNHDCN